MEAYAAYAQAHTDDPLPMERIGETLIRNGQYRDAVEALTEARTRSGRPGRADAWMVRAVLGEGRADDALRMARALTTAAPTEPLAWEALAEVLGRRGELSEQTAALNSLVALRPDAASLRALGRTQFLGQQFLDLRTTADRLKALDPRGSDGFLWSALARLYTGDDSQMSAALEDAHRAVALAPKSYRARLVLGRLLRRKRDWAEASAALLAATRLAPSRTDAYLDLAAVYAAVGRTRDAEDARKRFAEGQEEALQAEALLRRARRTPNDLALQLSAFASARAQGNQRGAVEALTNATRIAPKDPRVLSAVQSWRGGVE